MARAAGSSTAPNASTGKASGGGNSRISGRGGSRFLSSTASTTFFAVTSISCPLSNCAQHGAASFIAWQAGAARGLDNNFNCGIASDRVLRDELTHEARTPEANGIALALACFGDGSDKCCQTGGAHLCGLDKAPHFAAGARGGGRVKSI